MIVGKYVQSLFSVSRRFPKEKLSAGCLWCLLLQHGYMGKHILVWVVLENTATLSGFSQIPWSIDNDDKNAEYRQPQIRTLILCDMSKACSKASLCFRNQQRKTPYVFYYAFSISNRWAYIFFKAFQMAMLRAKAVQGLRWWRGGGESVVF